MVFAEIAAGSYLRVNEFPGSEAQEEKGRRFPLVTESSLHWPHAQYLSPGTGVL
jgi:hypothetical protein